MKPNRSFFVISPGINPTPPIMKLAKRLVLATLATAIALPVVSFAAKGDRKKKDDAPAFAAVDKDSDGTVTQAEYVEALKGKLGEEVAKAQFAKLDKDSNGKLTKEEFGAADAGKKKRKKKDA